MRNFLTDQVCATLSASRAISSLSRSGGLLHAARSLTTSVRAAIQAISIPVVVITRLLHAVVGVAVGQEWVL